MAAAAIDEGVRIPVVVEIDIGMKRVGVEPGPPLLALSKAISDQPGLAFKGLMGYEGHVLDCWPLPAKKKACYEALDILVESRNLLGEQWNTNRDRHCRRHGLLRAQRTPRRGH